MSAADPFAGMPAAEEQQEEFQVNLEFVTMCPDCLEDPPNIIEEFSSGDMVCGSCGLVVGDRIIDTRSEWRTFANDDHNSEDPSRVGDAANPLLEGSQLETSIAFSDSRMHRQLARVQNQQTQNSGTKALQDAYRRVSELSDEFRLGHGITDAGKHIYKVLHDVNFLKGKSVDVVVATCVFIAARQNKAARTFREVAQVAAVDKKDLGRMFKQVEKVLKSGNKKNRIRGALAIENFEGTSTTGANELVARFCHQVGFKLLQKVENIARDLTQKANGITELAGRSPPSLAAACIYMAAAVVGEPRSPKAIAEVANVSDGTLKTVYKHLYPLRATLIKQEWLDAYKTSLDKLPAS
jgi:transcription initiation factor TFIIB